MAKNEVIYQGLSELNVIVEDTSTNSPDYFRVTDLPTELTAGLNTFKFKGNVSLFPENSAVYIEILDANGLPVYYEVGIDLESQEQLAIVTIFINEDTTPGNGSIIICSTLNQSAEGQILDPSEINVRWQVPIYIDISKRNEDAIIFSSLPGVTLTSSTGSHKEISYFSFADGLSTKSQTQQDGFTTYGSDYIKYYYNNDTPVIILPTNMDQTSFDNGGAIYGFLSHIENASINFTYSRIVFSNPTRPSNIVQSTVSASISSYSSSLDARSLIAYLSEPLSYALSNSNDRFYPKALDLSRMNVSYVMPTETDAYGYVYASTTQNTYNIVTASFSNLRPLTGEIAKITTYYKSSGINEYILLNETDITSYADEFGFNTSSLQTTFSLPTSHRNEKIDFKFEFVNPAGNASKQVLEVRDNTLIGGNTYIGGDDNLMTGSLFVAGATGTGVHISGKSSAAMIRSIGYEGFAKAVAGTGRGGFVIYSGSISQSLNASERYAGVGIELFANTSSYFKYTTSGSGLLDIRTKNFFLGDPAASYISGSGTIFQISSSNFSISPQGNVSIKGDINATTGIFQNISVTGRIPSASIGSYFSNKKYLLEPWFTASSIVNNTVNNSYLTTSHSFSGANFNHGVIGWTGSATADGAGKRVYDSGATASLYYGGLGMYDNISAAYKVANFYFRKWGDINRTYILPEYNGYLTETYANPVTGFRYNSVDTVVFRVANNAAEYSLTSNTIYIPDDILNLDTGAAKAWTLQFSAKFGNKDGFKYVTQLGINPTFEVEILDLSSNVLYTTSKIQDNVGEWMQFNIPITHLLLSINPGLGTITADTYFKIRLKWYVENNGYLGTYIEHVRLSELRIIQLPDVEGIRASTIQFQDSYIAGDISASLHDGNWVPTVHNAYDLGSLDTKRLWRKLYAWDGYFKDSLESTNVETETIIVQSTLDVKTGPTTITGSLNVSGSARINDILILQRRTTTPTPVEGMIIASGSAGSSKLFYYNGTTWNALF